MGPIEIIERKTLLEMLMELHKAEVNLVGIQKDTKLAAKYIRKAKERMHVICFEPSTREKI